MEQGSSGPSVYWCQANGYGVRAGVPGGLVGGPRAYQDSFREFKYHRVHARRDFFLRKKND